MVILILIGVFSLILLLQERYHTQRHWYLETLINEIPFDSVLLDNKWRFRIISQNAVKDSERRRWMIGKTEMDYWVSQRNDPEKGQIRKDMFCKALLNRRLESIEEVAIDKEGNEQVFLRMFKPVFDQNGKHLASVGFSYELTQIKQKEHELEILNKELRRSNEDLDSFAYATSHDLKTPLRNISSFLQLFERKNKDKFDDTDKQYIQFVSNSVKQMDTLINSLLTYSCIDKHKEEPKLVNLNCILETVKHQFSNPFNDCLVHILIASLPSLVAHDFLMMQLFQNLISNGIKYNKSILPTVYVFTKIHNEEVVFGVRDNGIGIPSEYKETIFKVFQRLHKSDEYEGSGIGLAACKRIVELYGGRIWFESVEYVGTTFYFTLPLCTI